MKTLPRADFATHIGRLSLLGGLPALGLAAYLLCESPSRVGWFAFLVCLALWIFAARAVYLGVSHVLNTIANLISAIHDGDFSVRGKSRRGDADVAFAFAAINRLADVLREERLSAIEATELLRKVIEAIDTAIFTFDNDTKLCLVNPAGERLLGAHAERLLGQSAEGIGLGSWLSGESPRKIVVDLPGASGAWEVRHGVIRQAGRPHTLVVAADVSRLVRDEERQAWKNIIRVLSHEINNSLAPIASISQGLQRSVERKESSGAEDLRDGLAVISRRATSLRRFMESYGRLARLPAPEYAPISVDPWVRRIARLEERVTLVLEGPADALVEGDEGLLEQALINLVRNAADASTGESTPVQITWGVDDQGRASIHVVDAGPGLGEGVTLFVPFFTTKPEGTGIGLVLSREIVEAHGGRLTVENRKDARGCIAKIVLPRARRGAA